MRKILTIGLIGSVLALSGCALLPPTPDKAPSKIWLTLAALRGDQPFCIWDLRIAVDGKVVNRERFSGDKLCTSDQARVGSGHPFPYWREGLEQVTPYWGYEAVTFKFKRNSEGPDLTCIVPISRNLQIHQEEKLQGLKFIFTEKAIAVEQWTSRAIPGQPEYYRKHSTKVIAEASSCSF